MSPQVTVYTLEQCPYCVRAKNLLQQQEISFKEVRIKDDDDCARVDLEERTGMKTFPQIFFGNRVIGGFSELQELEKKVGLKNTLAAF